MKNVLTRMVLLFALVVLAACGGENKPNPNPDGNGAVANPAQFTAVATSAISVQLTWSEVTGATKYLLERKITAPAKLADADFVPWLELGVAQTTYEDFLVPDDSNVTYRVKATNASGSSTGKEASATTSVQIPNPLTVQATFDTALSKSALLGTTGGTLSVTGANGVIYTLTVPADALPEDRTLTLTPFIDLIGSPLSGGTLGAVRIEPEDLLFFVPATLSIELPNPTPDDGLLTVAFAFEGSGSEFHFVPSEQAVPVAAELSPQGKPKIFNVKPSKGGSQGTGRSTKNNVNNQTKTHPPTKPADQKKQQKATQQANDDELAPLVHPLDAEGKRIELNSLEATEWIEIITAEEDFGTWLDKVLEERKKRNDPEFHKSLEEAIARLLAEALKTRMETDVKVCKDPDLIKYYIYVYLKRLGSPAQQSIQRAWNKQFPNALKDIETALYQCWEWRGIARGTVDLGPAHIKYDVTLEVIFHPHPNPALPSSWVEYTIEVISAKTSVSNQSPCSITVGGLIMGPDDVKFLVDFEHDLDNESRLSYFGLGKGVIESTMNCPNAAPIVVPNIIFWMNTVGQTTQFVDNPNSRRIKGKFELGAFSATWDYVRKAVKK
jgi:hypothetical protein